MMDFTLTLSENLSALSLITFSPQLPKEKLYRVKISQFVQISQFC